MKLKTFMILPVIVLSTISCQEKQTERSKESLTLVAKIVAKDGKEKELEKELEALLAPTRAEKGCVHYDLHYSLEQKGAFLFHETWATKADWERHMKTPHLEAFFKKETELVESIEMSQWRKN